VGHFIDEFSHNLHQQPDQNESELMLIPEAIKTSRRHKESFHKSYKNLVHEAGFAESKIGSPLFPNKDAPEMTHTHNNSCSPNILTLEKSHDSIMVASPSLPKLRSQKSTLRIRKLKLKKSSDYSQSQSARLKPEDSPIKISRLLTQESVSISTARYHQAFTFDDAVPEEEPPKSSKSAKLKVITSNTSQVIKWTYINQSAKALEGLKLKTQKSSTSSGGGLISPRKIQTVKTKTIPTDDSYDMSSLFKKVYKVASEKKTTSFGDMQKPIINSARTEKKEMAPLSSYRQLPKLGLKSMIPKLSSSKSTKSFDIQPKSSRMSNRNKIYLADLMEINN